MTGTLPAELGYLSSLVYLNLKFNELGGPIPTELAGISTLEVLDFSKNELSGPIPTELAELSNLEILDISGNELTGKIPKELRLLSNLETLDLAWNHLAGPIPVWLGSLTSLKELCLAGNQLTGPIPSELSNLSYLQKLNLSWNPLVGSIPASLGSLTGLKSLTIIGSQLTGPIPSELSNLSNLTALNLSGNRLTGAIPPGLSHLSGLRVMDLSRNQLTGHIPTELGSLSSLRSMDLSRNQLTGPIPPSLRNLSNLGALLLSGNSFTGCIPEGLAHGINNDLILLGLPSCTALPLTSPFISMVTPGMGSLSIAWRAPRRTEGPPITAYDLRYIKTSEDETVKSNWTVLEHIWMTGSGALTYEITGLTNEIQYDVQMRAVNSVGLGPWSLVVNGTPTAEDLPPRSPANVWYYRDGSTTLISWDSSPRATHYKVYYDDSIDFTCGSGSSGTPASCEELAGGVAGTSYTHAGPNESENYYWISACNDVGCSDVNVYNPALFVASAPVAPTIVSVKGEVGSLTVTWKASRQVDDSAVLAYDLRYVETQADETVKSNWTVVDDIWTTGSGALIYDLAGLTDETQYDVQVRGINPVGEGHWSETFTGIAGYPASALAVRSFSRTRVQPGGEVIVTITAAGYGVFGSVDETLPFGFRYVSSSLGEIWPRVSSSGRQVRFILLDRSVFTYTVAASNEEGSYSFSGFMRGFDRVDRPVSGASSIMVQAGPSVDLSYSGGNEVPMVRTNSRISVTATFSEPVYGFTADDISLANGYADNFSGADGDLVYTFDVTPTAIGDVTVEVFSDVAEDAQGHGNTATHLALGVPYDDDHDGVIGLDEAIAAIEDYFSGDLAIEHAIAIVQLYFSNSN